MNGVLKHIHDHIREKLSVSDLAGHFGYSKWHFCVRFKEFTGRTFVEYVRHYRIQLAAQDILLGRKVVDVAADYGYDTPGGFNKAFLKEYGCLPVEYRKQAKESQLYHEKRRISMFQLSDRCSILREEAVNRKEYQRYYDVQAFVYTILGQAEAFQRGVGFSEAVASGMARTIEGFTPFIAPGELIVGFHYGEADWIHYGDRAAMEKLLSSMDENGVSGEDARAFREVIFTEGSWKTDGNRHLINRPEKEPRTEAEIQADAEWAAIGRHIGGNHSVIGHEKVLRLGFEGLLEEIGAWEEKNGDCGLYRSAKMICRAACKMGEKYARKAEELLASGDENYRAEDLEKIISACRNVPRKPAGSFLEAVQALWFSHILNVWEDGINANSLGRLDQILFPYYKADIEKGVLTKEEAFEILCCLWLKLYRDYDVQQSCVGGTDENGVSQVNDLSWLMLDVTEQLNFIRCLSVRFGRNTEREFVRRALEVVGHVQKGVPFFFNDDVMVPALTGKGISLKDACGYTQIGCVETVIPGKSNPHAVSGETNLLKALEYALADGHSMMHPEYAPGVKTGDIDGFATYEQLYAAVLKQIDRILDLSCSMIRKDRDVAVFCELKPYKSLLTEGCLETGRDFNNGGALYDYYQVMLGGIPNLADSLVVIRRFVYQDQKYTLKELRDILNGNFADEVIRQEFINKAPKFGNDIEEVDRIAADIMDYACDSLDKLSEKYGLSFHAQPFTFLWMLDHGRESAASPDGRRRGEPIAYSCSPMQGRDFNGLTALLNSIACLPSKKAPGTTSAIVEIDPKLFCDRNIALLAEVLMAAGEKGLANVQFNVIDAETLVDAQKHPEKYSNLAVRVSGFSQKFNLLSEEMQNHIIGRTKHRCL